MSLEAIRASWARLEVDRAPFLKASRIQAHWAAQAVAAVAGLLPPKDDDSHTNLEWVSATRQLAGGRLGSGHRVALGLCDLTLEIRGYANEKVAAMALHGRTLDDALGWVGTTLHRLTGESNLVKPTYEMPGHSVSTGGPFVLNDSVSNVELASWYANADAALRVTVAGERGASPVRCWPHHFDIASLISLDRGKSIGVGMSPGDTHFEQPYFYVNPWPTPKVTDLPDFAGAGAWHTGSWIGAALLADALDDDAGTQAEQVHEFVTAAIRASRTALEKTDG